LKGAKYIPDVLITNFNYKNALAAVRALGKKHLSIVTSGPKSKFRVSSFSRYSINWKLYTDPRISIDKFIQDLLHILKNDDYEVLIPIGVDTSLPISYFKKKISSYVKVPLADYNILEKAHDKLQTIEIAKKVGVPVPRSITSINDLPKDLDYPVVVKARKGSGGSGTRYANSYNDLKKIYNSFQDSPWNIIEDYRDPLIQEYVPGEIRDVCVLFTNGKPRAALAQKRILTYPPHGGVGIVNETILDNSLIKLAINLLKEMKWHGVAQVEFRLNRENLPYLMEVNPKFWGTLDLSIAAGMNFPFMLYKTAVEGDVKTCFNYTKNVQLWWIAAHYPQIILSILKKQNTFRKIITAKKITDISLSDLKPDIVQMFGGITNFLKIKRLLEYPKLKTFSPKKYPFDVH
jgi:predicted ATP-grasp superfamily ATP-dependent carboligase